MHFSREISQLVRPREIPALSAAEFLEFEDFKGRLHQSGDRLAKEYVKSDMRPHV
jgi:hypothetical protein